MASIHRALFFALLLSSAFLSAECTNDNRTNKNAGIQVTDFTISGTQTISATDLARITSAMTGPCFDEDSEEMEERVRAAFQDRGYFKVEVKSLRIKPRDPLGVPKPVTLEGEVSEGPQYRLGEVTFVKNHAFPVEELRQQFPLKKGDLMERDKVASGLESLRKLYGTNGYLEYVSIPDTEFGCNGTVSLNITIEEGPQYHMGKLDLVAAKETVARLRSEWKLAEGAVYDATYIDHYLDDNRDSFPVNFNRENVQIFQNCPDALVEVRMTIDPAEESSHPAPKGIPCANHESEKTQK